MSIRSGHHCIAYLTAEYPAVSHTFILREVEALRAQGHDVLTCSIRTTPAKHHIGPAEKAAAQSTFYVLQTAKRPARLLAALGAALARPATLFSALRLALSMRAPGLRALIYQLIYLAEAIVLAHHLRAQGVTHLHNHFANASATVAMLACELTALPFSYTLHGPADLQDPQRWRLDLKTARATFVACISHFARSQAMLASDPIHWDKLRIVHCAVDPDLYVRPEKPKIESDIHLVFVGRLAAVKGLLVLFDAFTIARQTQPNLRLTLVGDGDARAGLEAAAAAQGLQDAIHFAGFQSQAAVADILAGADALVLPSFAEGVPVVLMEAMASEIPVIATRVAGVSELVEDGTSGYLVSAGDAEAFAQAIVKISQDPDARRRMGAAGRAKVVAEFETQQEAARLAALFHTTGGTAPRPEPYWPAPSTKPTPS